jgi:crotonobetainyl-CoA:carnitine CoA-transferase CaiB-like acyl-CoA transferase
MPGPLEGIKVVDLTTVLMGPYATRILGDFGADIVKVESLDGDVIRYANRGRSDGMSNLFLNNNRNKRSLALNLKHNAGRKVLLKLAERSDVLISNVRPGAMARLGLSYADVAGVNGKIVYVSCVGFGQRGPYAGRRAYDDLIQSMVGIPNLLHRAYGDEPKFLPSNFCDRVTALTVVNAVTAALFHRERTGDGQHVEVPMYETMVDFVMSDHLGGYTFEPPEGPAGYERIVNRNRRPYRTRDGYLALLVYSDEQWREFLALVDRTDLIGKGMFATMNSRADNAVEVYGFVEAAIAEKTTSDWLALLDGSDLPCAEVPELENLFEDEHLVAVDFFKELDHPTEGRIRSTDIPSQWSESRPEVTRQAPRLGEHSREILGELGLSDDEIETMAAADTTLLGNDN